MSDPKPDQPEMDVYSGVRWSAVAKYGTQGIRFAVTIVLARLLAPADFGLLAMAFVVTGFLEVFQRLGLGQAIIQRKTISEELLSSLFYVNTLAGCLLAIGMVAGGPVFSWVYGDPRIGPIIAVLGLTFVTSSPGIVPAALLTRRMAFHRLALVDASAAIVNGATAITLALCGWGVWALVCGGIASSAARTVLLYALSRWWPRPVFRWSEVRSVFSFGANLTGFQVFNYFARNADNLIIGVFLGPVALGYYALAYKLLLLPRDAVSQVVTRVLFPAFSRMQDDDARLANAYLRACGAVAFISFPMMAGLAVVAQPFLEVVLGDRWLPAVPLIWILAPLGAISAIQATVGQIYLAKGRTDWMFWWGIISGALKVLSFILGLPWGVVGVATSYAIVTFVLQIPGFYIPFRLVAGLNLRRLARSLQPYATFTLLMTGTILAAQMLLTGWLADDVAVLTCCVLLGMLTYGLLVLLVRPPAFEELRRFASKFVSRRLATPDVEGS